MHARKRELHRLVFQIVIARACFFTVLVFLSNPFRAPLTDRKNSCGGRASCILKYSRTWYVILGVVAPRPPRTIHTWWKLTVYCNYLFILRERSHTRCEKACCVIVRERARRKHCELCIIHDIFLLYSHAVRIFISH